jgi:hypothetical protein
MTQAPPGEPHLPNPFFDEPFPPIDPYYIDAMFAAALANMANAALSTMLASSQSNNQMLLEAARHSSHTAMEELAAATKGANLILDSADSSGNGSDPVARRLKKIYRLLKKCSRPSGAPVVT